MSNSKGKDVLERGVDFTPDWEKISGVHGVVPVCVQDVDTKAVLGIMYMNLDAFELSCATKVLTLYSTSRKEIWEKGKESGEWFEVVSFRVNCDQNSLLCFVTPRRGGICHVKDDGGKPHSSCFYREVSLSRPYSLHDLDGVLKDIS